jgi:hypothetical protein
MIFTLIKKVICSYLNKSKNRFKIRVIFGKNCEGHEKFVLNRINFFFEPSEIKFYKDLGRLNFLYIILTGQKLFFGLSHTPRQFTSDFIFYNIDPCENPNDGWVFHNILAILDPFSNNHLESSKKIFHKILLKLKLKEFSKSYLFATGSSLEFAIKRDWDDGYKIVCNTIVKDKILWNHIRPDIIVAADAIYHFGDNLFALAFREDLKERLKETPETIFVYPSLFHTFVKRHFSGFLDRLIPIPIGNHKNITVDLDKEFSLPGLGNVFNLLLLPLGATFSSNIYLWGFNGRAPNDVDFWKNSERHFYQEYVYDLKAKHPRFFSHHVPAGREEKYVESVHGDSLDNSLSEAEGRGWSFFMMHETYTPALRKRIVTFN